MPHPDKYQTGNQRQSLEKRWMGWDGRVSVEHTRRLGVEGGCAARPGETRVREPCWEHKLFHKGKLGLFTPQEKINFQQMRNEK